MSSLTPPVDFAAVRTAWVAAVGQALGLGAGQFVYEEPETMDAPRPGYPYVGITVLQASAADDGPDGFEAVQDQPGQPTGLFVYEGTRRMDLMVTAYARTHEAAFAVASTLQARLWQQPTRDTLRASGLVVQQVGDVANISELLNTSYEGRAQLDVTLGMVASMQVDMGIMLSVPISGTFDDETTDSFTAQE